MPRIITVTLNPAIDQTVTLATLHLGAVNRASRVAFNAGGKGVNVASCLADFGAPRAELIATGLLGGANDGVFKTLFAAKNIADRCLRVPGETRTNIKLSHDAETTDINLPGLAVDGRTLVAITETLLSLAAPGAIMLLAGSLPAGVPPAYYAEVTGALRAKGADVILDTSGDALAASLAARTLPDAIKPNRAELEACTGRKLPDTASLIAAAQTLIARGIGLVTVSLGPEGALFVTADDVIHASAPPVIAASTVGAGDAMVAGMIAARAEGADLERTARLATAFALSKLGRTGPHLPPRPQVEASAQTINIQHVQKQQEGADQT